MKIKNTILILCAMALLITASCTKPTGNAIADSDSATGGDIKNYDIYEVFKTASAAYLCEDYAPFGDSVQVYTVASISIQWPRRFGDADVKSLQDTIIAHTFSTPKASIDSCIVDFISKPLGYGECVLKKVDVVPDDDNVRELSTNISVKTVGFCENYVVFKVEHDQYSGGAHPNYFASFVNYDLKAKRVLTFHSIFKHGVEDALLPILEESLMAQYYAESLDELEAISKIDVKSLYASHEIYLTGDEVVFFYNPYEIAPWSVGTVEIPVNAHRLAELLTDDAKLLFGI